MITTPVEYPTYNGHRGYLNPASYRRAPVGQDTRVTRHAIAKAKRTARVMLGS